MQFLTPVTRKWIGLFICCQFGFNSFGQLKVSNLLCENLSNPIGIDVTQPRFSWQLVSSKRNVMQTAYEIRMGTNASSLAKNKNITWNSGKMNSDSSVHVAYMGTALQSGTKYFWQVRVWDNSNKGSPWSEPAFWQMGLLSANDWKAKWIEQGFIEDSITRPTPLFRKEFKTGKKIQSATAYITAHGMYEGYINGKRIGDFYLTPGWTSYNKRMQ
jgi:alpha-L-rhamnosidase